MKRKQARQRNPTDTPGYLQPPNTNPPVSSPPSSGHRRRIHFHSIREKLNHAEARLSAGPHLSSNDLSDPKELLRKIKQKTKNAFHRGQQVQETIACLACYDEHPRKDLIRLGCLHSYCKQCFEELVLNAIHSEDDWPPGCCGIPVDHTISLKNIPRGMVSLYKQKRHEYSVPIGERYYCPVPDCGLFVPADKVNTPYRRARCKAKHITCMDCRWFAHTDAADCPQNSDMLLLVQMAVHEGWRRCPRCLTMIEHRNACRHMRCRCGAEFCFVCGAKWWTCGCTERQLKELKDRVARNAKQRREEEERRAREARWRQAGLQYVLIRT